MKGEYVLEVLMALVDIIKAMMLFYAVIALAIAIGDPGVFFSSYRANPGGVRRGFVRIRRFAATYYRGHRGSKPQKED